MCLIIIVKFPTPVAIAASINSFFFIDKVCPRTILDISSHEIKPMPINNINIERPNMTSKSIKSNKLLTKNNCYGKLDGYGYREYKNRNLIGNSKILSANELCKKAKRLSFKRVIEISKDQNNSIKQFIHECF